MKNRPLSALFSSFWPFDNARNCQPYMGEMKYLQLFLADRPERGASGGSPGSFIEFLFILDLVPGVRVVGDQGRFELIG
jgi:hypothetical protein